LEFTEDEDVVVYIKLQFYIQSEPRDELVLYENFVFLAYYATGTGNLLGTFQDNLSVPIFDP
jgi:hypothetical protein